MKTLNNRGLFLNSLFDNAEKTYKEMTAMGFIIGNEKAFVFNSVKDNICNCLFNAQFFNKEFNVTIPDLFAMLDTVENYIKKNNL